MKRSLVWSGLTLTLGLLLTACPYTSNADSERPTVTLGADHGTVTAAGPLGLSATASDNVGVVRIEILDGDAVVAGCHAPSGAAGTTSLVCPASLPLTAADNGAHRYTARATDAAANVGVSEAQVVTVSIPAGDANHPPVAAFSLSASGLSVTPADHSSDPDGDPIAYAWDWGDGTSAGSGATPGAHLYAAAGTYRVHLTVTDPHGAANSLSLSVTVAAGVAGNRAPTAAFSLSVSGLAVTPTNTSSDPDGDPLSASWTWGDGSPSSTGSAPHPYAAPGNYTVTLAVTDGRGGSATSSQSITVGGGGSTGATWDDPAAQWDSVGVTWQ